MEQRQFLVAPVSDQEILKALNGIGDLKSPGIDGYGAKFFKSSWDTIKDDINNAVYDFFNNDRLLKAFNCTIVTLIPKHEKAVSVKDYRPIAGCTILYKIISKILTARLGKVLNSIVSPCQAAFVPRQQIHNHILLAYELIRGYARKNGTPRCMIQLDLQKAYDMVDWFALETILLETGIPKQFVKWIMLTVTSVTYRFNINGNYTKSMKANRGIRQRDPLSPVLFVIIMEYLNRLLHKMQRNPDFNHHSKCEKLNITNLAFADDVLLFAIGDYRSVEMLMQTLNTFSETTGLVVNPSKCNIYFGGVDAPTKTDIMKLTGFKEGPLPFKYLGVPLTSKKSSISHYLNLIDRITGKINHWSNKLLSYAGRLQLIKSVTFSIANYWMQCFPLPKFVIHKINTVCRNFLWTGGVDKSRKSPVAWTNVCRPRKYGGLNVIPLQTWNHVTMMKLLWSLSEKADNLWVKWVHTYYLKNQSIMEILQKTTQSWIMRSILNQRVHINNMQSDLGQKDRGKFSMKTLYLKMRCEGSNEVVWNRLFCGNPARPRALMTL